MRILSGSFKGRPLIAPKGSQTRPTLSIVRKAVFDILQPAVSGADFLDLFAGSGAMGIEALSRGARRSVFVENHREAVRALHKNLNLLKIDAVVLAGDVLTVLKKLEKQKETFQIIYADPPYQLKHLYTELLQFLDTASLLQPGGYLFLESRSPIEELPLKQLVLIDKRRFGTSLLHQYRRTR